MRIGYSLSVAHTYSTAVALARVSEERTLPPFTIRTIGLASRRVVGRCDAVGWMISVFVSQKLCFRLSDICIQAISNLFSVSLDFR